MKLRATALPQGYHNIEASYDALFPTQGAYFPAMPDDNLQEAMAGMTESGAWYREYLTSFPFLSSQECGEILEY